MLIFETLHLNLKSPYNPSLYLRYVDDVFAIFNNEKDCEKFLEILNSQHPNIKFTIEHATATLPFLDVEIKLSEYSFDSSVWRKKRHTRLMLNYAAITPKNGKQA